MAGFEGGEILDHGAAPTSRARATGLITTVVIACGVALAAIAAGLTWWTGRPPTSDALEILGITVLGPSAVTVAAEPPIGGLATPAGAALPGISLRLSVGGDPRDAATVTASATDAIVYVEDRPEVTIAPGDFADIDVTVAPVDCALAREGANLDEAGYRWRSAADAELLTTADGAVVPLSPVARTSFGAALWSACDGAGDAPRITVTAARRGGEEPLETISLFADVDATGDRFVVTPLDGPGLRGLGSADRRNGTGIPLLWLVSPRTGNDDDTSLAYTQVFVVRGSTAYPWIIGIPLTDDLPAMTPLTRSIR
jgi:hypothetical protein